MQTRDFCFWLQGFFELNGEKKTITKEQVKLIKQHLALVFKHEAGVEHEPAGVLDGSGQSTDLSKLLKDLGQGGQGAGRQTILC